MVEASGKTVRENAVSNLIESAARETSALASILSATGNEIQNVSATSNISKNELTELNNSIEGLVNAAAKLEDILFKRLELIKTSFTSL